VVFVDDPNYAKFVSLVLASSLFIVVYLFFRKYQENIEESLKKVFKDEEFARSVIKYVKYFILLFGVLWVMSILGFQLMLEERILYIKRELIRFPSIFIGLITKLILALFILWIGLKISTRSTKVLEKPIFEIVRTRLVATTLLRAIRYGIILFTVGIAMYALGFRGVLTSLAAGIGIASVVVGVAAGPIIMSFLSGMFILGDKPFEIGDFIEVPSLNIIGEVVDVGMRITKIKSTRGNLVVVPNNEIIKTNIINYKKEFPYVKIVKKVQISYDSDIEKAKEVILNVLKSDKDVCEGEVYYGGEKIDIGPKVFVLEFADSGINIEFWFWIKGYDELKEREVASRVQERIFKKFKESGIVIPYPHRVIISK